MKIIPVLSYVLIPNVSRNTSFGKIFQTHIFKKKIKKKGSISACLFHAPLSIWKKVKK